MMALQGKTSKESLSFNEFQTAMELEKILQVKENCEVKDASRKGYLPKDQVTFSHIDPTN